MKILLLVPHQCDLIHSPSLPLGLISIASYLQKNGYKTKICDFSTDRYSISKEISSFKPDIIGITFPSAKQIDGILSLSKKCRKAGIPIVWGGPFCDMVPAEHLFRTGLVDIISYREGEQTWLELVRNIENHGELSEVKGIAYLSEDGSIRKTEDRPFLNPCELPRLDWSLVNVKSHFQRLYGCNKVLYLYWSKGCTGHCTFCYNSVSHLCQRKSRLFEAFISEVDELVKNYGMDGVYFADEVAFLDKADLYLFGNEYKKRGYSFKWGFQTRIGLLKKKDFQFAFDHGCRWIDFGIESGSELIRKQIQKEIPTDLIDPTFAWCSEIGLISIANFIIGFPNETEEQMQKSICLAQSLQSTQNTFVKYLFSRYTPMGQSILQTMPEKVHYNSLKDYRKLDFFLNTDKFSKIPVKDINVVQSHFLWSAIFRKDYLSARDYDLLLKSVWTALYGLTRMNFKCGIRALSETVISFSRFFIDEHFRKKTKRKYGLK